MRNGLGSATRRPRGRRRTGIAATALALLALALAPALAHAVPIGDSSAEKQEKLLDILESFVPRAEAFWCENSSPGRYCDDQANANTAGWFDADGSGVGELRGEGAIVYIYSTLLAGRPAQASFAGFDREDVIEYHLHQAIRHLAYTHHSQMGSGGWGGPPLHDEAGQWQVSWGLFSMVFGALQQWDIMSSRTRAVVKAVAASQADELTPEFAGWVPEEGDNYDTKSEENAWNAPGAAAAAALLPLDDHFDEWDRAAKALAINSFTKSGDDRVATSVDGRALSNWASTVNIRDDYTVTNHGFFHPVYTWGTDVSLADAALLYRAAGLGSDPEAFNFRVREVWDNVMARLATDDGDFLLPSGSDWPTHDYGQVPYLGLVATRLQRDDAAVLETRAIDNFAEYYDSDIIRSTRVDADDGVGGQADVFRNIAVDYWLHEYYGPAPDPDQAAYDTARARSDGVWTFEDQKAVVGRFAGTNASMSWNFYRGRTWPTGLVYPDNSSFLGDPALVNPWMTSAVDGANSSVSTYSCDCSDDADHFSTAAMISSRMFSMSAFRDGTALFLDRGTGATASFGFESIAGFTGSRTIRSDSGTGVTGNLRGDWANVGDRFGLVVKGGSGMWFGAGTPPEQPAWWLRGSLSDGTGHRGAVVFPNATGATTDALEPDVIQPTISDSSWSALTAIAQNGAGKVAVARWGGGTSATVSGMTSSLGVPIPDRHADVTVTGSTGSTTFTGYDSPESRAYEAPFFVTATPRTTVTVTILPGGQRMLIHNGGTSTSVTVKYDAGAGAVQTVTRSLAADQAAMVMVDQGTLRVGSIIASSTEPPGTYHAKLAFDFDTTSSGNFWVADGVDLSRSPQCLTLDFGSGVSASLESVEMTPRRGYGPKDYRIETGSDRASSTCSATTNWAEQARVTSSGDGTVKNHSWSPVSARYVRIKVTAGYGSGPPHFVQIREFVVS